MHEIHDITDEISDEILEVFRHIDTSTIGHLTTDGYIPGISAQTGTARLIGRVMTVSLPKTDGSVLYHALVKSRPGDVIVVSMPEHTNYACWGELRTIAALIKNVAGMITDGCVTDITALRALPFPVFATGISPITTCKQDLAGTINAPVTLAGQEVLPGSLAIGDEDGLFILSPAKAAEIMQPALEKQKRDAAKRDELLAKLRAG